MLGIIRGMVSDPSVNELASAIDAGVLALDPLGLDQASFDTEALTLAAVNLLTNVVGPRADTYPLFDDSAGGMLRAMLREGHLPDARLAPATQAGLAGRYIDQLEAFPDARMQTVLEARDALASPLVRLRAGISAMAAQLETTPLDDEFGAVADDVYRREIAPELQELRELAEERRLLPALRRQVTEVQGGTVVKAALAIAATTVLHLSDFAQVAIASTATAADIVGGAVSQRHGAAQSMAKNKFLWLYEAPKQLARHESRPPA